MEERIALCEANIGLVRERDDCYLEYIILLTQRGDLDLARELLTKKRFNIYEGGEGKLTRHHGWLCTLQGFAAEADDPAMAMEHYRNALIYPANYGEGRHYSAQEANIYYFTGKLCEKLGDADGARAAYTAGANQAPQVSEMSVFAALCQRELGDYNRADAVLRGMCSQAEDLLENEDLRGYFGVGSPCPPPYEQDVVRWHRVDAYLLMALGKRYLGDAIAADEALAKLRVIDPYNSRLCFLTKLGIL